MRRGQPNRRSPPAPLPGSSSGSPSSSGSLGKSSLGRTRRWKLEPPLRISTSRSASRSSISTVGSPSERASSARRRPGSRTEPVPSASASRLGLQAHLEIGRAEADAAFLDTDQDSRERLGRGAGRDGAGDDRELGDELVAFGFQLQVVNAFLSWIRACGKARKRGLRRFGNGFAGCGLLCGGALILTPASAVRRSLWALLWIADAQLLDPGGELGVLAALSFDPAD